MKKYSLLLILGLVSNPIKFVSADIGDYGGCFGGMMSGVYFNPFAWIIQLLIIIVLGLAAVWLWKQIQSKNKKK